ncbi:MAG: hypothetical protein ABSD59_17210 [Terracidiphilus sp.]
MAKSSKASEKKKPEKPKDDESVLVDVGDHKGARKVLRQAVKAAVKVKSAAIAEKLVSKVEQGDMRGTEMVLSLIEKKKQGKVEKKKKKRSGPSWAELLASEPEWDESTEKDGQEAGTGTQGVSEQASELASKPASKLAN